MPIGNPSGYTAAGGGNELSRLLAMSRIHGNSMGPMPIAPRPVPRAMPVQSPQNMQSMQSMPRPMAGGMMGGGMMGSKAAMPVMIPQSPQRAARKNMASMLLYKQFAPRGMM